MTKIEYYHALPFDCPHCHQKRRFPRTSIPRFGPGEVKCSNCGTIIDTLLTQWTELTLGQKIKLTITEYFSPSWIGARGSNGFVMAMVTQLFLYCLTLIPIVMLTLFYTSGILQLILGYVFLIGGPLLPFYPFYKMVKESKNYSATHKAPVWNFGHNKKNKDTNV